MASSLSWYLEFSMGIIGLGFLRLIVEDHVGHDQIVVAALLALKSTDAGF